MLLVSAIAIALLTILGAAGEAIGIDRYLKTNTVKHRTLSLLNQGLFRYAALPNMKQERAEALMAKFGELLRQRRVFREVFGLIWRGWLRAWQLHVHSAHVAQGWRQRPRRRGRQAG